MTKEYLAQGIQVQTQQLSLRQQNRAGKTSFVSHKATCFSEISELLSLGRVKFVHKKKCSKTFLFIFEYKQTNMLGLLMYFLVPSIYFPPSYKLPQAQIRWLHRNSLDINLCYIFILLFLWYDILTLMFWKGKWKDHWHNCHILFKGFRSDWQSSHKLPKSLKNSWRVFLKREDTKIAFRKMTPY